jgi:hypothetical protein
VADDHSRPTGGGSRDDGQPASFFDPQGGPSAGLDVSTTPHAYEIAASTGVAQARIVEPEGCEVSTQDQSGVT